MHKLFVYNPTCEMAVQNGSVSYQPPLRLQTFESDMADIMLWLSQTDDIVVANRPDDRFIDFWSSIGKPMPAFVTKQKGLAAKYSTTHQFSPWGDSIATSHYYGNKFDFDAEEHKQLFSRITSAKFEQSLQSNDQLPNLIKNTPPTIITTNDQLADYAANGMCALKSLWSSSGRGIMLVRQPEHIAPALTWAKGKIRHDGAVVGEPFLQKLCDFSFQFNLTNSGKAEFLGLNHFSADSAGRFDKEIIGQNTNKHIFNTFPHNWMTICVETLRQQIEKSNWAEKYSGIIGIDAIVYTDSEGDTKIRCCVEINIRYNMGLVNMELAKYIDPKAKGFWQISQFDNANEWTSFCNAKWKENPPQVTDNKICKGFLQLTGCNAGKIYGAWGEIE